jgi:hypothetical protein
MYHEWGRSIYIYILYTVLMGTPDGKRPLGRRRRRYVDNIKMDRREIETGCVV